MSIGSVSQSTAHPQPSIDMPQAPAGVSQSDQMLAQMQQKQAEMVGNSSENRAQHQKQQADRDLKDGQSVQSAGTAMVSLAGTFGTVATASTALNAIPFFGTIADFCTKTVCLVGAAVVGLAGAATIAIGNTMVNRGKVKMSDAMSLADDAYNKSSAAVENAKKLTKESRIGAYQDKLKEATKYRDKLLGEIDELMPQLMEMDPESAEYKALDKKVSTLTEKAKHAQSIIDGSEKGLQKLTGEETSSAADSMVEQEGAAATEPVTGAYTPEDAMATETPDVSEGAVSTEAPVAAPVDTATAAPAPAPAA